MSDMPHTDYYCPWCNYHSFSPYEDDHCAYCNCKEKNCSNKCVLPSYRCGIFWDPKGEGSFKKENAIEYCNEHNKK